MPERVRDIVIGKVVGSFGIKGEVKILVLTEFPERFEVGKSISLKRPDGSRLKSRVERGRVHKGVVLAKLSGVESRNDAEALRDAEVVIDESELASLEQGRFYVFDIIGLKVLTTDGRDIGEVEEILQSGANDVYVTTTGVCIPALKDVVEKIDLDEGVMLIRPVPGLLPDDK